MKGKQAKIVFIFAAVFYAVIFAPSAHAAYLASDLLGQIDADGQPIYTASSTNNGSSTVNNIGFSGAIEATIDTVNHRLFVMDGSGNKRVLVFNLDTNNNLID